MEGTKVTNSNPSFLPSFALDLKYKWFHRIVGNTPLLVILRRPSVGAIGYFRRNLGEVGSEARQETGFALLPPAVNSNFCELYRYECTYTNNTFPRLA